MHNLMQIKSKHFISLSVEKKASLLKAIFFKLIAPMILKVETLNAFAVQTKKAVFTIMVQH